MTTQKLPPEVFGKKGVLRNFGKFTGKQETLIKKCLFSFFQNFDFPGC